MSGAGATLILTCLPALPAAAIDSVDSINQLSIEDLGKVEITSVSKKPEELRTAAAAVYVITHDDIIRSGATRIPDILRLAPNLYIAQISPDQYVITTRGFSGNFADQNFSNKLLVLVDGRSVYSPLFSGVYWDTVDVLPEDIERIEVISGPGATMWGANAENGVINIITRKASETQGGLLDIGIGNQESMIALQYGARLSDDLAYRVYVKAFDDRADDTASGTGAHDGYYKPQAGFRLDWSPDSDMLSVKGNFYYGAEQQPGYPDAPVEGRNLQTTWQHQLEDGSSLQVLAYYDESRRSIQGGGTGFSLDTYNLEVQHAFSPNSWNDVVWGAGDRINDYSIVDRLTTGTSLLFVPPNKTLNLLDVFAQDRLALTDRLDLILGLKLEDDPWSGWSPLPTARISWKVDDNNLLWAAASRAIRAPTPFDTDVLEKAGTASILGGNPNFLPEELMAYEVGYRADLSPGASISLSGYYDDYDHLRSLDFAASGPALLQWGNLDRGTVYGLQAWGNYQAAAWWRLSAGLTIQQEALKAGSGDLLGITQEGDDPHHQAQLHSSMTLTDALTLDGDLRYVGALPNPRVPQYFEFNTRLGWKLSDRLELSLSGFNLLHPQHQEFTANASDEIKRSVFVETRWKF